MKIKNLILLAGLFVLAFSNAAFVIHNQVNTVLSEAPVITDQNFVEFLSLFEKVEMPFNVGLGDLEKYEKRKGTNTSLKKKRKVVEGNNERLLRQFINNEMMMSRMGPPQIMPVARFYPNDKMIAVVYIPYRHFGHADILNFKMALFDLKGSKISTVGNTASEFLTSFDLALTSPYRSTQTFSINENGYIWKRDYKNIWKEDVETKGVEDNEIVDYELTNTFVYQIKENGLVEVAENYLVEDRASLD